MKKKIIFWMLLTSFFLGTPCFAGEIMQDVTIKTTKLTDKMAMLEGGGGNITINIGEDGVLMVDTQAAALGDKILAAIQEFGGTQIKYIFNTHWHYDHTGGNSYFGKIGTLISHTNVREKIKTDQVMDFFKKKVPAQPKEGLPVITFDQSLTLYFNGEEIKAVHYPNTHTDGDAVIFFTGSNVVAMGDLFFAGKFPFVDLQTGGNVMGMISNISQVISKLKPDVKIVPGHGPVSTLEDLKNYWNMISATTQIVRDQMRAGKSLEEIQAAGLPGYETWDGGFISTKEWIGIIYESSKR